MKIIELKIMDPKGGSAAKLETATTEAATCYQQKGLFRKVPASQLSLKDSWMEYQPKTDAEWKFKKLVEIAIKRGLKDFWRPICDPSCDGNGGICYEPGKKPVVLRPYNWWVKSAKEFKPEQGSRLATKTEYIAFLAVLIKELVNSGMSVEWAWNAVCNDSKELGHYWNCTNAKKTFEDTGSREICGFFDLANTYKILAEDEEVSSIWLAGGNYCYDSNDFPLAHLYRCKYPSDIDFGGCGWIVLTEGSTDH